MTWRQRQHGGRLRKHGDNAGAQRTELSAWFTASAQHIRQHLAHVIVRELPDVGHFAPMVAHEPVAEELISFVESV